MRTDYNRAIDDTITQIYRSTPGYVEGEAPRGPWTCIGETDGACGRRHRLARHAATCLVRRRRQVALERNATRVASRDEPGLVFRLVESDRVAVRCSSSGPVEVLP